MKNTHLEMFVERFKQFQHFESFQIHFSKLGIICYIIPDSYIHNYSDLSWRGIIEWKNTDPTMASEDWYRDDCGSYQDLNECRTKLIEMVLDFCCDRGINFLEKV